MTPKATKTGPFPQTISVRGINITVHDWDELEEVVRRFGADSGPTHPTHGVEIPPRQRKPYGGGLAIDPTDRSLLQQFVEAGTKGVISTQVTQVLGKKGRGIPVALDDWSRRIGLVNQEGATAFQAVKRRAGRGFRMTEIYLRTARSLLEG